MIRDELQVTVRSVAGASVLDLVGDLTMFADERLRTAYQQLCAAGSERIVLNFRRSEYINSAGLAILIGIATDAQQRGQQLALCGLTPHFQKIFRMVGIGQYAALYDDEAAALAALSSP